MANRSTATDDPCFAARAERRPTKKNSAQVELVGQDSVDRVNESRAFRSPLRGPLKANERDRHFPIPLAFLGNNKQTQIFYGLVRTLASAGTEYPNLLVPKRARIAKRSR